VPPPEWPDRTTDFVRDLASIGRRIRLAELLRATTVSAPLAAVGLVLLTRSGVPALAAGALAILFAAGLTGWWLRRVRGRWTPAAAARAFEAARPSSRNVVITAEELLRHPERAVPSITTRVLHESAEITRGIGRPQVVPLGRASAVAIAALVFAASLATGVSGRVSRAAVLAVQQAVARAGSAVTGALTVSATIIPPAYTREASRTMDSPERIEALQGSRLHLTVAGEGTWRVRFGAEALAAQESGGARSVDLPLTRSGYLAIERADRDESASRRLIPVTVIPDRAPTIRVDAPGKDLLLPDVTPVVGLSAAATDDFGLQSLELRYT
jgi:hypothetical protein